MAKKVPVTIAIDQKVLERLDKLAKALGQSRSAFIDATLREAMEDTAMGIQAVTDPAIMGPMLKLLADRDWLRAAAKAFSSENLEPEQLDLFSRRMQHLANGVESKGREVDQAEAKPEPDEPRGKSKRKGGKRK